MSQLVDEAALWGVEFSYFDVQGTTRNADPEVVRRVVELLSNESSGSFLSKSRATSSCIPEFAFQGDGHRRWLLTVQLYAVRSDRNWGHGDFSDLAALMELVADLGGAGIGLNPLHALFYDLPGNVSPYSPNSRLFLNPLYIDVASVPEFQSRLSTTSFDDLRGTEFIDYAGVAARKLAALRAAYADFANSDESKRRREFEDYRKSRGWPLDCFTAFETLRHQHDGAWWTWPERWRKPTDAALRAVHERYPDECGFHAYMQWIAETQLQRCRDIARDRGMSIGLYLDTAVGVDAGGADAWLEQGCMLQGLSIGAPPDLYNPAGQDWGLTTYNPHGLAANNFEPFRRMLRAGMRYAGALRLDHVLGLMRLFVIPRGLGASQGVYLQFPFSDLLRVIQQESVHWKCIAVGEDLGTVPDGFRPTLAAWGIWSYLVMLFERDHDGSFRPPEHYGLRAIATFATHDLPTYEGWISGHDLMVKRAIGIDPGESDEDREASRAAMRRAIGAATGSDPVGYADVVSFLAATPTLLLSITIEDLLDVEDQVNVPGTVDEHPNWRRKLPVTVEQLKFDQRPRRIAETLSRAGRGTVAPG